MVCDAMAGYSGWAQVDREQVEIIHLSHDNGSTKYKISAPDTCTPAVVGLHAKNKDSQKLSCLIYTNIIRKPKPGT